MLSIPDIARWFRPVKTALPLLPKFKQHGLNLMPGMFDKNNRNDVEGQAVPIPDEAYFFDNGDCLFLAEGVLFKLHRWILCRDPDSMFRDMFSVPQGPQVMGLDPISISDTRAEFRALCWVLYALPNEIHLQTTREADVQRLVHVAKMSHKYNLPLFETWALKMILLQCEPPLDHLATCTQDVLGQMMALATLCDHPVLLCLVESAWISRLSTGELRCSDALVAGEKHATRKFQGDVYYQLNKQIHSQLSALSPTSARGFSDFGLTDKQLLCLLSGHILLSNFWCRLREDGLPYSTRCNVLKYMHDTACVPTYANIQWPLNTADVLMGLRSARQAVAAQPAPTPFGIPTCIVGHLDILIHKFTSEVANYFLEPSTTT
ncbi:hypothetical protein DFH07DRAFT_69558 [Mycena maculata]|uniref:BTB domain-containing protein n=1 Tax=Mycena maculata TaxID=230809 RepID=A0AAD7IF27_9AGAR|nr:hypothetical protein DFH07DRAFT_69558 [Mycena maculata]